MVLSAYVSVHTDDPGVTGEHEIPGRKPVTFVDDVTGTATVFDLEAGSYPFAGLWSVEGAFLGSAPLDAVLDVAGALVIVLTLAGGTLGPPASFTASTLPAIEAGYGAGTFSYWEKVRKDFSADLSHDIDLLKPFYYQSYAQGVTLVRWADGTFSPVTVVTEELEAMEGVRILWGGKNNPVTEEEADELAAAGYGDYLTTTPENAYGDGAYNEGDFGA